VNDRTENLLLVLPGLLLLGLAFFLPIARILVYSVAAEGGGMTTAHFSRFLGDAYFLNVLWRTVRLSALITLICAAIGFPLAYIMARVGARARLWLVVLVILPLMTSVVVRTFGWMVILGRSGLLNYTLRSLGLDTVNLSGGWFSICIAMVHVLLPFMVLSIASALEGIDGALEDAAMTLGATPAKTFLHIVLPLSREGVVTGTLLVFALCTGSFVTVMLMGSNATMVLPLLVYQQLNVASDWPFAAALGTILILVVVAATVIQLAFARQRGRA
jgi:putative spermidine/putrescine transport system permease protein